MLEYQQQGGGGEYPRYRQLENLFGVYIKESNKNARLEQAERTKFQEMEKAEREGE